MHLSGSERERKLVSLPLPEVDRFVEIRSPKGKRDFDTADYRALYRYCFPEPDEQSPWSSMVGTITDTARIDSGTEGSEALRKKYGSLRYRDVVALNGRRVVGFTSFVTMPLDSNNGIVYSLYTGMADKAFMGSQYGSSQNFRGRDLVSLFMVLRHGMAEEDAQKLGYARNVAGTMMDASFIGQGHDAQDIRDTRKRLDIYGHLGALVLMLDAGSGCWITPCFQPALAENSNPLLMHLLFRERQIDYKRIAPVSEIDLELARNLARAYASSYDWQSSPVEIDEMRGFMDTRFAAAKRAILVRPEDLPNMAVLASMDDVLKKQVERDYGSLSEHARRIERALKPRF
ncbi:MAG: hypothetical protein PHF60_05025 [Candidatus ainarchaeum sp.]|nr:hypothetical protein [Candidatus ainarchaeum sp.]